ncbi:biotin-dependent carboxyltransferase family protein [Demequina sp.]|uniref:5-oxoprolinase subunit C family protein n=1 Tax=Demequina sp. TaxID=2050685 RepID=UPI0025DB35F1|nr:biotin-dependent carboxyltransferase family protein [Demequina sp.]
MTAIEIVRAGPLTTVQDLGRRGHAHLGVPRAGAADLPAHRRANALVGNGDDAATLETTMLGFTFRALAPLVVAVEGAACAVLVGAVRAPWGAPFRVAPGQTVEVGPAVAGLRSYLAVRGGIEVEPVLGSRSSDTLSGLGPAPLANGDAVAVGAAPGAPEELFGRPAAHAPEATNRVELKLRRGPRQDWLGADGWGALAEAAWQVSDRSNRVGVRLEGRPLVRARSGEIASEGLVTGAVQLPPSGRPVIFLADHPTTGGYPVVGVLDGDAIAAAAQARPGVELRFRVR